MLDFDSGAFPPIGLPEIAVVGPRGAVEIIFHEDLGDEERIAQRTGEYRRNFANPFVAAHRGYIDDVIAPHATRKRICRSLANRSMADCTAW